MNTASCSLKMWNGRRQDSLIYGNEHIMGIITAGGVSKTPNLKKLEKWLNSMPENGPTTLQF